MSSSRLSSATVFSPVTIRGTVVRLNSVLKPPVCLPRYVAHGASRRMLRRAKMESVSEVLQLPVIIEGMRPLSAEFQFLQKRDFLLGRIAAEGRILEEVFEPRLFIEGLFGFPFNKPKSLRGPRGQSAV